MISLNANALVNASAMKASIDTYVQKGIEERFAQATSGTGTGVDNGWSQDEVYRKLIDMGLGSDTLGEALKGAVSADELAEFMQQARAEINRRGAEEKLKQSKQRMDALEQDARRAISQGDAGKLARIAREATGLTRSLADEAKGMVKGWNSSPIERAAAIAAGMPDPADPTQVQPGMTAGGVSIDYARAYVKEVRDVATRARNLLTHAEGSRNATVGLSEEEREERDKMLRESRQDLAETNTILTDLEATLQAQTTAAGMDTTSGAAVSSISTVQTLSISVSATDVSISIAV